MKKYSYDVTVIVATYNQNLEKIFLTLQSILEQRKVKIQIIVADDGSKENHFVEIKSFFYYNKFLDYILLPSDKNNGTVINYARCFEQCKSKYTKLISPGDFLYGSTILYDWINHIEKMYAKISFCDAIFYQREGNKFKPIKVMAAPQVVSVYNKSLNRVRNNQLIYNDLWLGASILSQTELMAEYFREIVGKVKFGEDNIYRLMAFREVESSYFPQNGILYEYGAGVSNSIDMSNVWHKRLMKDWFTTSQLILELPQKHNKFYRRFKYFSNWKINSTIQFNFINNHGIIRIIKELFPLYAHIPMMLLWHLRIYLFSRYTDTEIDDEKINYIFKKVIKFVNNREDDDEI